VNRELRKTVIAGNWKMNMLASGTKAYADELLPLAPDFSDWCEMVVCAPFALLTAAMDAFAGSRVRIGAQNMSEHESGAYTGEVSSAQLKDIGAEFVIIGHSERRALYGETDETVNKKVHTALNAALCPIICVGESLRQREIGITFDLVAMQVKAALYGVPKEKLCSAVIAYEPIWAIGTGKTATPEDAQDVCREIRAVIQGVFDEQAAKTMSILYGGSMNDKNAFALLSKPDIDGGLIGGASLNPASFATIINAANQ
jgi:triosephosphate isomerase